MRDELTQEWLDVFDECRRRGDNLADSIFWRLAITSLPLGVDRDDTAVRAAIEEIKASVELWLGGS